MVLDKEHLKILKAEVDLALRPEGVVTQYEADIKLQEDRESASWELLQGWNFSLYANTLTLFAAPEGNGKTMLTTQFCANALRQGKSVCFLGNEESSSALFRRMKERLSGRVDLVSAITDGKFRIITGEDMDVCYQYNKIVPYINDCLLKYDVVIIDQLNYFTESGDGTSNHELYKAIPKVLSDLKKLINGKVSTPAFIVTQQMFPPPRDKNNGLSPETWSMNALLRDSKNSKRQCTSAVMYFFDTVNSTGWLKVDKFRETVNPLLQIKDRVVPVKLIQSELIVTDDKELLLGVKTRVPGKVDWSKV